MKKIAYISLLHKQETLRQHLPMGAYWPCSWLSFIAPHMPILQKKSDWEIIDWWWEFPSTATMAQGKPPTTLRAQLIGKLPEGCTHIALAPEILKLGGGIFFWRQDFKDKEIHLITGLGLDVLGCIPVIKQYKPKQIIICLGKDVIPLGLLNWLSQHTEFLVVRYQVNQLAQLELWQSKAIYETGVVIKLCSEEDNLPNVDWAYYLSWEGVTQVWQQGWLIKGEKQNRQPMFLLCSQSRQLKSAQAELLLCRDQPSLWSRLDIWQQEGCFEVMEQWLTELSQVNLVCAGYAKNS